MTPNKFLKNRSGIYGIRNLINSKIYVGKTKCMYRRCHQYVYDFNHRKLGHLNDYMINAITKAGLENFEFFPLEFAEPCELTQLELNWMLKLRSTHRNYGYNLRMDSSTGMVVSSETSKKISDNLKRQWASGVRNGHAEKLRKKWASDSKRRKKQGELFTQIKTKYEYKIYHPCGKIETGGYKRLVELDLKNVIANFHRKNSNDVMCKGFRIIRSSKGES